MECDLLIKGGNVVDGTGKPSFAGDIAVRGGKIAAVIPSSRGIDTGQWECKSVIDACGLTVTPGFIDIHSHCDYIADKKEHPGLMEPFLEQGVTTMVGGNCGFSPAPLAPESAHLGIVKESTEFFSAQLSRDTTWTSMDSFISYLEKNKISVNLAMLTGHGTLRWSLWGRDYSYPGKEKMREIENIISCSFEEGSYGLSLGLGYEPGLFVEKRELEELASLAKRHGRILTVHNKALSRISGAYPLQPFDTDHNLKSLEEVISLAEKTGVRIHISHLMFVGEKTWPNCDRALEMIDRAKERGVDISFDSFPYFCGNTTIYVIYPTWFLKNITANFKNPLARTRLHLEFFLMSRMLGFAISDAQIMWGGHPDLEKYNGMFFTDIARDMGCSLFDAYLKVSEISRGKTLCLFHKYSGNDREESVYKKLLAHPLNTFETDAILTTRGVQNPATFGAFPRIIQRYHKELGIISLEEAIAKMTGNSASRIGIKHRGTIAEGNWADITIFDYAEIRDNTTLTKTEEKPSGMKYVFINGEEVVRDGRAISGKKAGMALRC
ncbi:MAG: N-acyl-D-amino-acid deacylase family protein [Bacillota bacterium]